MVDILNTWQFNLVAYLISVVTYFQCYKLAVKNVVKDGAATFILQTIAGLSILILLPFHPMALPESSNIYVILIMACIFYAINDRAQTTARKHLEVSTFSIIGQLSTVFLIIFGLTVFREPFVPMKLIGALLILSGNVLLFYKNGGFRLNKYAHVAIMASLAFAIAMSIDIGIAKNFNLPLYISLTLLIPSIMIILTEKIPMADVWREYTHGVKKYFYATGIAWGLAIYFSLRAFSLGSVTTIVPLQGTAVFLNVIIAYLFLHERKDLSRKLIAALLVLAGIALTVQH